MAFRLRLLFEFVARLLRGWLIDNAGKKADLVLGAKMFRQALMSRLEFRAASAGSFANNLREFESLRDFVTSVDLGRDYRFAVFVFIHLGHFHDCRAAVLGAVACHSRHGDCCRVAQIPLSRLC